MEEDKKEVDIDIEEGKEEDRGAAAAETGGTPGTEEKQDGQAEKPGETGSEETEESGEKGADPRDLKIAEQEEKRIRLMAEFENFRKRSEREKEEMFSTGARSVIEKILPVVDNFERALQASAQTEEKGPFMEGMEMVYKQLVSELGSIDVKPIEALGKPFDPALHNAVMQEESEEQESGTVLRELQKGYTYRGQVVRYSMVSVVK